MPLIRQGGPTTWFRMLAVAIVVWAVLVGLVLLEVFPYRPRTPRGWVAILVGGPPAYVIVAWLGERVIGSRLPGYSPRRFSPGWFAMMTIAILVGAALVALGVWLSLNLGR